METINTALHRNLKSGKEFNGLFEKVSCKKTSLGNGDTFHSIDKIKEYSLQYQYQTADVATRLQKNSLAETVYSFFKFCYDHFQYAADGAMQNIKSPACAWHSRKEGMDCKSFSVMASTLCSNAGIKHYIRKIKQPFFHPEQFTHVYVIVPIDQKTGKLDRGYYVIDGTTHDNIEAQFIEKPNDTFMEHTGLNGKRTRIHPINSSVARKAINSCGRLKPGFTYNKGGKTITQHGLNGADTSRPMKAFCDFMKILRENGVPSSITTGIMTALKKYTSQGIDPQIAISTEGMVIEGELFRFNQPGCNVRPLDFAIEVEAAPGLAGEGDIGKILGDAVKQLSDDSDGWLQSIFSKITGFFSCYGTAANPKTVEAWLNNNIGPWLTQRFAQIATIPGNDDARITTELNLLLKQLATIRAHQQFHKGQSNAKCSRDANQAMSDYISRVIELMYDKVYRPMEADYYITSQLVPFVASNNSIPGLADNWKGATVNTSYGEKTIKLKPGKTGGVPAITVPVPTKPVNTTPSPQVGTTPFNPGSSTTKFAGDTQPQKAGAPWLLIALLAGGMIYGAKHFKNNAKTAPKK